MSDWRWAVPVLVAALGWLATCARDDHDRLGRAETAIYWLQYGSTGGPR